MGDLINFDGAEVRIERLGLASLFDEVNLIVTGFTLLLLEKRHANSAAVVREMIDERFLSAGGWRNIKSGGVDWTKEKVVNGTTLRMGVEVQVSMRSDGLITDVEHLRDSIIEGRTDVGVIVTSTKGTAYFLTDRVADYPSALKAVERARATDLPLVAMGIQHDGATDTPLQKRVTNLGTGRSPSVS